MAVLLACIAALALSGCAPPGAPDGRLVLAVLSPERVMVADPRSGATVERAVPGGTLCHGPVLAVGGRVLIAGTRAQRPVALALPRDLRGPARSLGRADVMSASSARGRVWLGRWTRRTPTAASVALREVDAAGRVFARAGGGLGRWGAVLGVVGGAPLVDDDAGLRLAGAAVGLRGSWPLAVGRDAVAWCRGDDLCDAAGVWRPGGGVPLDPPPGVRVRLGGQGAFSPDGRRLALPVHARGRDRVGVVELVTGRWRLGAPLAGYRAVAWSPSGAWVYSTGRRRLAAWAPGHGPPRTLPIRTGGTVMSIATTG